MQCFLKNTCNGFCLSSSSGEYIDNSFISSKIVFLELGKRQLRTWSQFDVIINGGSLKEIQDVIEQGRLSIHAHSRGGLMLTHLSSAYDQVDLLEWLVVTKGVNPIAIHECMLVFDLKTTIN